MYKLIFWVSCDGWKEGGYKNTHYFKSEKEAKNYLKSKNYLKLISLEKISYNEFLNDYMGDY
jgi:hypothetical protein